MLVSAGRVQTENHQMLEAPSYGAPRNSLAQFEKGAEVGRTALEALHFLLLLSGTGANFHFEDYEGSILHHETVKQSKIISSLGCAKACKGLQDAAAASKQRSKLTLHNCLDIRCVLVGQLSMRSRLPSLLGSHHDGILLENLGAWQVKYGLLSFIAFGITPTTAFSQKTQSL